MNKLVITILLSLLVVGFVAGNTTANTMSIKVLPTGLNVTFTGDVAKMINSTEDCQVLQQVVLKAYVEEEYQNLLKPSTCLKTNDSVVLFYNFTHTDVKNTELYTKIKTPKIMLKTDFIILIPKEVAIDGKLYKIENVSNAKVFIGRMVPSVSFYEVAKILNDTVYIRITPTNIVYIVSTKELNIDYKGNIQKSLINEDNISYYVYTTKYDDSKYIGIKERGLYIVNIPYKCYEIKEEGDYAKIIKVDNCPESSQLVTSKVNVLSALYIGNYVPNNNSEQRSLFSNNNLIYITIGIAIVAVVLLILLKRE